MKTNLSFTLTALVLAALGTPINAAIVPFDLIGTAGAGLLPGNEPAVLSGGTGGEIGAGISYDNVTKQLTINVGWGSSQGFTDLSSTANNSHIHGPTAANNGNGFTQTAGVLFTLTRSSSAVTGGTFIDAPITLSAAQEADLFNGKYYINIHTINNAGGEMRGFLIPTTYVLTVTTNGSGSVAPGSGVYASGSNVVLTATPSASYVFTNWTGDVTSTNNPITVTMTNTKAITANFVLVPNPRVWTNTAGGNWNVAANWSPNSVPTATDDAFITNNGTYTVNLNAAATVNSLTVGGTAGTQTFTNNGFVLTLNSASTFGGNAVFQFTAGTVNGSGLLTISNVLNVSGSGSTKTFSSAAGVLIASGATMNISNNVSVNAGKLENAGTINITDANQLSAVVLTNRSGGLIDAKGVGNGTPGQIITGGRLDNVGTIRRSTSTATNSITSVFNNYGAVDVQTGVLSVGSPGNGGGNGSSSGSFSAAAGTEVRFSQNTSTTFTNLPGAQWNGAGLYVLNESFRLEGNAVMPNFEMRGGTVSGGGILTVTNTMNGTAGTIASPARILVGDTATLNLTGMIDVSGGAFFENAGTVLCTGAGSFRTVGAGVLTNRAGALFNVQNDATFAVNVGAGTFDNAGTYRRSVGTGTNTFNYPFNNYGTMEVQSGTFYMPINVIYTQSNGVTRLNGGNITNGSALRIEAGELSGTNFIFGSVTNRGTLNPGSSPGRLTIDGNFRQTGSSVFNLEIGGNTPATQFDQLFVTGQSTLAGTLNVNFLNGFYPAANASFLIFTNAVRSGTFTTFNYPSNEVGLVLVYTASTTVSVVVTNVRPLTTNLATQTVGEGQLLSTNVIASDGDVSQTLAWTKLSGPTGLNVTSGGVVTWTPSETQGNTTNQVVLQVADNGTPVLRATNTFTVIVPEINQAPVFTAVPSNQIADVGVLYTVGPPDLVAQDADIPVNPLTYSLVSPPAGMTISTNGVISWLPQVAQSGTTHLITVIVTDANATAISQNQLSTTNSFNVVLPAPGDRFWTNGSGGIYQDRPNWLNNLRPGPADNANFTNNDSYNVTWTADATAANAFFKASSDTVFQAFSSSTWQLTNSYILGPDAGQSPFVWQVSGGLRVTNAAGNALLEVRRGTLDVFEDLPEYNVVVEADRLVVTNATGFLSFESGKLNVRSTTVANSQAFVIGDGNRAATLNLLGNGAHSFANGLTLRSNATLMGNGSISGKLTVTNGATLTPGASIGKIILSNTPSLLGRVVMEVSKSGATLTNDVVQVTGILTNGGTLIVTNIGPDALAAGDFFRLFVAPGYSGNFSSVTLPALPASLFWVNQLNVDGSIRVGSPADTLWTNTVGGSYQTASNWQAGLIPTPTNNCWFNLPGNYSVTWASNATVANAMFNAISGTVTQAIGSFVWSLTNSYIVGQNAGTAPTVRQLSGTLQVTNAANTALLEVRNGTNQMVNGYVVADVMRLTNATGQFVFDGGTLNVRTSTVANGQTFFVGNGSDFAELGLLGNGSHSFADGLVIRSNSYLAGSGTITGLLTVQSGGWLAPEIPERINLSTPPALAGNVGMQVSRSGSTITNCVVAVTGTLTYAGTLLVERLGPDALVAGDKFTLFPATGYSGSFSGISLPSLNAGLMWTNKLLVDGSIEVMAIPPGDRFWANATGGNYQTSANWSPNRVPTVPDNANFTNNASYQVAWTADAVASNAFFSAASGTVTQAIGAFTWQLTNSYVLGPSAGQNPTVRHISGNLRVANVAKTAPLDIRRGTTKFDAGVIEADKLLVTNSSGGFDFNGGTLITRSASISNGAAFSVGKNSGFGPATWVVLSNAVPTTLQGGLNVGSAAAEARLLITNGGVVKVNSHVFIGVNPGSTNNTVSVNGPGSLWTNSSSLNVGSFGSFSTLFITTGGVVDNSDGNIGEHSGSSNNAVTVNGSGSIWNNSSALYVGLSGSFNALTITNGGVVNDSSGVIGHQPNANNNAAAVSGLGSTWNNSGALDVGLSGSFNTLTITSGGVVNNPAGSIGSNTNANNNTVIVSGPGSTWANSSRLDVGDYGAFNSLLITNGGVVNNTFAAIGGRASSSNNVVIVSGPGSKWINGGTLYVGDSGSFNSLVITNGGTVTNPVCSIGGSSTTKSNTATVSGPGSAWINTASLDFRGSSSSLLITNSGIVRADSMTVGNFINETNHLLTVAGADLVITNFAATGYLDVRRGSLVFNDGNIQTDRLLLTNSTFSQFNFNGGALNVRTSTVANAQTFFVGNGSSAASLNLVGNGSHSFADGLTLRSNATLMGNGRITGNVTNSGGILSPGASIGTLAISNNLVLAAGSSNLFEINKTLGTNDNIVGLTSVTYGGTLIITNIGPDATATFVAGNSFKLFNAGSYAGGFTNIIFPAPLNAGLVWTNKLLVDGSIQVVPVLSFRSAVLSGTNLVIGGWGGAPGGNYVVLGTTNVATALNNWTRLFTNQFDLSGNFIFTNGLAPGMSQRFFSIQLP